MKKGRKSRSLRLSAKAVRKVRWLRFCTHTQHFEFCKAPGSLLLQPSRQPDQYLARERARTGFRARVPIACACYIAPSRDWLVALKARQGMIMRAVYCTTAPSTLGPICWAIQMHCLTHQALTHVLTCIHTVSVLLCSCATAPVPSSEEGAVGRCERQVFTSLPRLTAAWLALPVRSSCP